MFTRNTASPDKLRHASALVSGNLRAVRELVGRSAADFLERYLRLCRTNPRCTIADAARVHGVSRQRASQLMRRITDAGLLTRVGRTFFVFISAFTDLKAQANLSRKARAMKLAAAKALKSLAVSKSVKADLSHTRDLSLSLSDLDLNNPSDREFAAARAEDPATARAALAAAIQRRRNHS